MRPRRSWLEEKSDRRERGEGGGKRHSKALTKRSEEETGSRRGEPRRYYDRPQSEGGIDAATAGKMKRLTSESPAAENGNYYAGKSPRRRDARLRIPGIRQLELRTGQGRTCRGGPHRKQVKRAMSLLQEKIRNYSYYYSFPIPEIKRKGKKIPTPDLSVVKKRKSASEKGGEKLTTKK